MQLLACLNSQGTSGKLNQAEGEYKTLTWRLSCLKTFKAQNSFLTPSTFSSTAGISSAMGLEGACGSEEAWGREGGSGCEGGWGGWARIIKRCSRGSQ